MKIFPLFFFLFGLVALTIGIILLLNDSLLNELPHWMRTTFTILLILYGAWRVWTGLGAERKIWQFDHKK